MTNSVAMNRRALLLLAATVLPTLVSCGRRAAGDRRTDTLTTTAGTSRSVHYEVVEIEGMRPPTRVASPHVEKMGTQVAGESSCNVTVFAESYEVGDSTWIRADSVSRVCPAGLASLERKAERSTGKLRRSGDSLYFLQSDSEADYEVDRGMVRGDSLVTGGCPQCRGKRVFVRRASPSR